MESVATPDNSLVSLGDDDFDKSSQLTKSGGDEFDEDEPDAKRWKKESENEGLSASASRTVREPRVVVQTTSDIDILDDGYRRRKYGQKVAKGNPNPRQMAKQQTRNNSNPSGSTQNNQDTNDDRLLMLLQALNENLARQNECQAQFLEVMQRVTQPAPPQVVIAPPVRDPSSLFQTFRKLGAVPFAGDIDPLDADEWLVQTEKILEIFECTGRQKVLLAAFMFRGVAEMWWRIVKGAYQTIDDAIAWDTFKGQFANMFVPKHFIDQMRIEFEQLQQGSMTVAEYNHKFLRLSRFAEKLIDTEAMKVERFIEGLSPTIQKDVAIVIVPQTLEDAIKRAYWSEDANKKIVQEAESRCNVWPPTPDDDIPDDIPTSQEYNQQFERTTAGKEYQGIPKCDHCGKNHETSACRLRNKACFACGGLDHKVQDCASKRSPVQGSLSRKQLGACFLCGEVGHKVQNCARKRKRVGGSQPQVP